MDISGKDFSMRTYYGNTCPMSYLHTADQPEGKTDAWFKCTCGEVFGVLTIIEPFGKRFF
jgi:hypothetical protein